MHRTLVLMAGLALLGARPTFAQKAPDPVVIADSLRREIDASFITANRPRLQAALQLAGRAAAVYPKDALLHHYTGYAVYRMLQLGAADLTPAAKTELITQGLTELDAANKLTPMAESYILRWSIMGETITDAGSAMVVVNAMSGELAQAMRLGKENPRVWLVQGIGAFFTPAQWGGGAETALGHLTRAQGLFQNDRPAKPMPAWGRAETYAWLGITHQKLGHKEESRKAYEMALSIEPGFTWVKDVLLPGLEKGVQPFP